MHAISFQLKRAHLSDVAIGQRIFEGTKPQDAPDFDGVIDMTPARFDILYLVLGRERSADVRPAYSIAMTELTRRLGLSRATISRSIKRLRQLGLVTSSFASFSRRNKLVSLTEIGLERMKRAIEVVAADRRVAAHYGVLARKRASGSRPEGAPANDAPANDAPANDAPGTDAPGTDAREGTGVNNTASVVRWVQRTWQQVRDIALHHRDRSDPLYLPAVAAPRAA